MTFHGCKCVKIYLFVKCHNVCHVVDVFYSASLRWVLVINIPVIMNITA